MLALPYEIMIKFLANYLFMVEIFFDFATRVPVSYFWYFWYLFTPGFRRYFLSNFYQTVNTTNAKVASIWFQLLLNPLVFSAMTHHAQGKELIQEAVWEWIVHSHSILRCFMSDSLLMLGDCYSNRNLRSFSCCYYQRVYYVRVSEVNINSRLIVTTTVMWNKGYLLDLFSLSVCDWFINSLQNYFWEIKLTKRSCLTYIPPEYRTEKLNEFHLKHVHPLILVVTSRCLEVWWKNHYLVKFSNYW